MNKLGLTIFLLIAVCTTGLGQRLDQFLRRADTSYTNKAYFAAYRYYDAALAYDSSLVRAHFFKAQSARFINALDSAILSYEQVIRRDTKKPRTYPQAYLYKGISELQRNRLSEAEGSLEKYLALPDSVRQQSWDRLAAKNLQDLQLKMGPPIGEATNLGPTVNSPYSDVGPEIFGDRLYFTSLRFDIPDTRRKDDRRLAARVLSTNRNERMAERITDTFNLQGVNTAFVEFDRTGNRVYYCECEFIQQSNDLRCDLFTRTRSNPEADWGPATKLGINAENYTSTQPAIGRDSLGNPVLYFASNRPGGAGELDIWYAALDTVTGQTTNPQPLRSINTEFDDVTPFYHETSQRLFFATKGLPAFGDFDLYYTIRLDDEQRWSEPKQMPPPFNSRFADLHYTRDEESTRSYYASTRPVPEAQLLDENSGACCHDIYETPIAPIDLIVQTWDAKDSLALDSVIVRLYEIHKNGTEEFLEEQFGSITNTFSFRVDRYKEYKVTGNRKYYTETAETIDLLKVPDSVTLIKEDLYLKPRTINLTVLTYDQTTGEFLDSCRAFWYAGEPELGTLELLDEQLNGKGDSSFFFAGVELYEPYTLRVTRKGYFPISDGFYFDRSIVDQQTYEITVEVYLERLQSFNMFFDNDYPKFRYPDAPPDPDTTRANIAGLVDDYKQRENEFIQRAGRDTAEINNIRLFFSQLLDANMVDLEAFATRIIPYLQDGYTVTMTFRGYASPLGNSAYNERLTRRRIVSIINYLRDFEHQGVTLGDYIDGDNGGQIRWIRDPRGEDQVGQSLAAFRARIKQIDQATLESRSSEAVFSLSASIERRVEVTNIQIERNP